MKVAAKRNSIAFVDTVENGSRIYLTYVYSPDYCEAIIPQLWEMLPHVERQPSID